jgi:hypothetical protein
MVYVLDKSPPPLSSPLLFACCCCWVVVVVAESGDVRKCRLRFPMLPPVAAAAEALLMDDAVVEMAWVHVSEKGAEAV